MQARVASLLRSEPVAGQAFCRLLVHPLLEDTGNSKGQLPHERRSTLPANHCLPATNAALLVTCHQQPNTIVNSQP